ncbi:MAG: hypothetical protein OHK0039_38770 [Bacteroidia bacterium]
MQETFTVRHWKYYLYICWVLAVVVVLPLHEVRATHAMGADLRYEHISGNTYRFTLTVYRDCQGSALTNMQNIAFQSDSCGIARYIVQADRVSITELTPLCPPQQPLSTCNGGILPGVEQHVYQMTYTLPQPCRDWQISWQLCCRNYAITNSIITPNTRIYIESYLNNVDVIDNNSPYFTIPPVPYLCNGEPFLFNNGTIDPDGDSLAFELIDPRDYINAIPTDIPYQTGFNVAYPMATAPPNNFNFDVNSGQFSFTPNGLQQGIVALLVKEYRNGVFIGSTLRDIQMVVINCLNRPPRVEPPQHVQGGVLTNNTFSVCAGSTLSFDISAWDIDLPPNQLSMTTTLTTSVPASSFSAVNLTPDSIRGFFSWPTTLADTGVYFFTVKVSDNGCPLEKDQSVGFNIIVKVGTVLPPRQVFFCPSTDSSLVLQTVIPDTAIGGSYQWLPSTNLSDSTITNPTLTLNGQAQDFTVVYTSPGNCAVLEPLAVRPTITLSTTPGYAAICQGDTVALNTQVTINGQGTGPVTYSWSPSGNISATNVANPLVYPSATTTYYLLAQTFSCSYLDSAVVQVDSFPVLAPIPDPAICAGDSTVLVAGGTTLGSASFSWSPLLSLDDPASMTPVAAPQTTTTYTLIATNGCGADTQAVTVQVFPPLNLALSTQDIACNGTLTGSVQAVPLGGAGGASYTWIPALGSAPTQSNLAAGTYTVIAVDTANCRDTASVVLSEPPPIFITVDTVVNSSCAGSSTGSITVNASGGTPGYSYALDNGPFVLQNTFTNLSASVYTVSVRDASGCIAVSSAIAVAEPATPVDLQLVSATNTNCNTPLGSITVNATGGNPGYTYTLFNFGGNVVQNNGAFTGLNPGAYQLLVADLNGCADTLVAQIVEVADPVLLLDTIAPVRCYGGNDGLIQVTGNSGTPPYSLSLDAGSQVLPGPTALFTGLVAGPHAIVLEDNIGCKYTLNFFITQPDSLYATLGNFGDVTCFGGSDGTALVLAGGGVEPYLYGTPLTGNNFITGLSAGTTTIPVRDANNCPASVQVTIDQPDELQALALQATGPSCYGYADGSILIGAIGGSGSYQYAFNGSPFVDSGFFSGLRAGSYPVQVIDSAGCLDSVDMTIVQPDSLWLEILDESPVLCYEGSDGEVRVQGQGGTLPYQYSYDTTATFVNTPVLSGLRRGSYAVIVRDQNGCEAENTARITEPDELRGDITATPVECYGDSNGTATAVLSGGVAPYTYDWSNGATSATISDLPAGNYVLLATDDNDCTVSLSTEVLSPPRFAFDTLAATDVTCFGGTDGTLLAVAEGGAGPLTYSWSNGASDTLQQNVPAGTYRITVGDTTGCELEETLEIVQPEAIVIDVLDIEDAFCGLPTGSITIAVRGGTPDYTLLWDTDPPQDSTTAVSLFGGTTVGPYTVLVTDSLGCEMSMAIEVGVSGTPEAEFYTDFAPLDSVLWTPDGVTFTNITQGAVGFLWDFGDGQLSQEANPTHAYRDTGYYEVRLVAFDPNFLCPDTSVVAFVLLPPGNIFVPNAFTPNGDGRNDFFHPVGIGVDWVQMDIFTRWGPKIKTLRSMEERWNGYMPDGKAAPEGVYVWVLRALINDGTEVYRYGTVTLIR